LGLLVLLVVFLAVVAFTHGSRLPKKCEGTEVGYRYLAGSSPIDTFSILSPCLIAFTTSCPSITRPKTLCLPSSHGVATWVMKNCEPLVFGPALAIERMPGPVCFRSLWNSSANL